MINTFFLAYAIFGRPEKLFEAKSSLYYTVLLGYKVRLDINSKQFIYSWQSHIFLAIIESLIKRTVIFQQKCWFNIIKNVHVFIT